MYSGLRIYKEKHTQDYEFIKKNLLRITNLSRNPTQDYKLIKKSYSGLRINKENLLRITIK